MDETYLGGKPRNISSAKPRELAGTGRGPVRKTEVVGAKDRATNQVAAKVVKATDKENLQDFVEDTRRTARRSTRTSRRPASRCRSTTTA